MISQKLEQIFNIAIRDANGRRHEFLTVEIVFLALLQDPTVQDVLIQCGANVEMLKRDLEKFLSQEDHFSILSEAEIEDLCQKQFTSKEMRDLARQSGIYYQPEMSLALQRVLQRAAIHVQSSGKKQIQAINILVAMFKEEDTYAVSLLSSYGVQRMHVVEKVAHSLDRPLTEQTPAPAEDLTAEVMSGGEEKKPKRALDEFAQNLNQQVRDGKMDPLVGRKKEIQRAIQILCRRRKNNPILVGDSGVGKTAIAEGLAQAIETKQVPSVLLGTTIYGLDMASLLAGTKFRGDFEERLKKILKELQEEVDNGHNNIVFIDEIHTIIGAGATSGGSMDASNLLKPALSNGSIRCMGSTTYEEYRKFFEKDQALTRRFQKLEVNEPTLDETVKILTGLKGRFEDFHKVIYSTSVIKAAVTLSDRYISDRKLPDKAIDIIDEAGAYIQLLPNSKKRNKVTVKDIELIVAQMAKVPKKSVSGNEKVKLKNLKRDLQMTIFGQDDAVEKVTNAILLARSGLRVMSRPIACFLFAGPTGVGKTELAKQLGILLGTNLLRFDMSEYMEKHSVSKLIGAPPGYVGHEQGGTLTEAVYKNPHSIVLLDEIEKAHMDIYNILLQVMDNGFLTDSNGRRSDFRNTILILTTNAGAKDLDSGVIGLGGMVTDTKSSKRDQTIKNTFTPEFRNRLDGIVHFHHLSTQVIDMIVEKFLAELEQRLSEKNVALEVDSSVKRWIGSKAFDPKMGARPIVRFIDEKINKILAQEILFGELAHGGKVLISLKDGELAFNYYQSQPV